jgi:hypothetical protein
MEARTLTRLKPLKARSQSDRGSTPNRSRLRTAEGKRTDTVGIAARPGSPDHQFRGGPSGPTEVAGGCRSRKDFVSAEEFRRKRPKAAEGRLRRSSCGGRARPLASRPGIDAPAGRPRGGRDGTQGDRTQNIRRKPSLRRRPEPDAEREETRRFHRCPGMRRANGKPLRRSTGSRP